MFLAAVLALGLAFPIASAHGQSSDSPNIVLILADDMGFGDVRALNPESKIPTPHMDSLAAEGRVFTESHSPSGVCTPTRYGILTGRYSWRTDLQGVLNGYEPALIDPERLTVASMLQARGYTTACVGKWHLGLGTEPEVNYFEPLDRVPNDYGFDYSFIIPASLDMAPYLYLRNGVPVELPTERVERSEPRRNGGGGFWREGPIAPSFDFEDVLPRFTREAVACLERAGEGDDPFFLYFPLNAPHTPWMPIEDHRGASEAGHYGDFVSQVDASIGQVLDTLDRIGATENTLVFVTSDNGAWWRVQDTERFGHAANAGRRGQKGDIWDGGHRVPFIARWPGRIPAGTETDEIICHTDFMATIAAIVNYKLSPDAGEDSYNILPALLGENYDSPIREATVHFSSRHMTGIRQGKWKLIEGLGSGGFTAPHTVEPAPGEPHGQLYNMEIDPLESTNVWDEYPDVVAGLSEILERYRETGRSR